MQSKRLERTRLSRGKSLVDVQYLRSVAHLSGHVEAIFGQADIRHACPFAELVPFGLVMAREDEFSDF